MIIDPELTRSIYILYKIEDLERGIYTTNLLSRKYLLLDSILYNNCRAIYFVNFKSLLEPGTFKPAQYNKAVEYRITTFPILEKEKRILKNIFTTGKEKNIGDLELLDICIIEDFYSNIVSEVRLLKAGV